jgi:hypothetical protein
MSLTSGVTRSNSTRRLGLGIPWLPLSSLGHLVPTPPHRTFEQPSTVQHPHGHTVMVPPHANKVKISGSSRSDDTFGLKDVDCQCVSFLIMSRLDDRATSIPGANLYVVLASMLNDGEPLHPRGFIFTTQLERGFREH